jgi:hypothetical protein
MWPCVRFAPQHPLLLRWPCAPAQADQRIAA